MQVYIIECEFDMNFAPSYETMEKAMEALQNADWEGLCDMSLEEVIKENLVAVFKMTVQ